MGLLRFGRTHASGAADRESRKLNPSGSLADPPGRLVRLLTERVPFLDHPRPTGVGLSWPRHLRCQLRLDLGPVTAAAGPEEQLRTIRLRSRMSDSDAGYDQREPASGETARFRPSESRLNPGGSLSPAIPRSGSVTDGRRSRTGGSGWLSMKSRSTTRDAASSMPRNGPESPKRLRSHAVGQRTRPRSTPWSNGSPDRDSNTC
jgi:hypothetical protein